MEELKEEVPSSIHFENYEKRTSKCWLVNAEDLELMYETLKSDEISLWCDAETADDRREKSETKWWHFIKARRRGCG